jgi:hypothetical protein
MTDADTPSIAMSDQLDARLRDVLNVNELEIVQRTALNPEWIRSHDADDLIDHLVTTALLASEDNCLSTIVAVSVPGDLAVAVSCVIVRRKREKST